MSNAGCYLRQDNPDLKIIRDYMVGEWQIDKMNFRVYERFGSQFGTYTDYKNVNAGRVKISSVTDKSIKYRFLYYAKGNLITRKTLPPKSYSHGDITMTANIEGGLRKMYIDKFVVPDNEMISDYLIGEKIDDNHLKFTWIYEEGSGYNDEGEMYLTRIK